MGKKYEESAVVREALRGKLRLALDPKTGCIPAREIDQILRQLHRAPGDPEEKLREKDQEFVNAIQNMRVFIAQQGYMPQNTALAFQVILGLFTLVENILWELKGEEGDPPTPQPPGPSPTPPSPEPQP